MLINKILKIEKEYAACIKMKKWDLKILQILGIVVSGLIGTIVNPFIGIAILLCGAVFVIKIIKNAILDAKSSSYYMYSLYIDHNDINNRNIVWI
ncbi:MAG: hypothetical protein LBI70_03320 [Rickettsiales bacterium]|jgi:hypothetical protein|nr:hypothetical protein [Rickettsiales bacterium]